MTLESIKHYSHNRLRQLWKVLRKGEAAGFPLGKGFEHFVLRAFELDA